jgi:hypothetical protein
MLHVLVRETHDVLYELPVTTLENTYAEVPISGGHAMPGLVGRYRVDQPRLRFKEQYLVRIISRPVRHVQKSATPAQYAQDAHYYGVTTTAASKGPTPEASCSGFGENENYG